jgi:hypothetical protein
MMVVSSLEMVTPHLTVVDEIVHPSRALALSARCPPWLSTRECCSPLGRVRAFLEQDDLWLLQDNTAIRISP